LSRWPMEKGLLIVSRPLTRYRLDVRPWMPSFCSAVRGCERVKDEWKNFAGSQPAGAKGSGHRLSTGGCLP
jgi:hypothetical protein